MINKESYIKEKSHKDSIRIVITHEDCGNIEIQNNLWYNAINSTNLNLEERCYEKGISCDLLCGRQWNDWFLCQSVEYSSWMCVFHPWYCLACWFNHSGVQTG